MFANIKNRFISVIAPDMPSLQLPIDQRSIHNSLHASQLRPVHHHQLQDKFPYARPSFLQLLTPDELRASADHNVRPIIVPRDINLLPWGTGYAECVNSGKSEWNEDQAAFCRQVLSDPTHQYPDLPYTYFGIFDGHAGYGAALAASHQFHHILHEKLVDCIDMLLPRDDNRKLLSSAQSIVNNFPHPSHFHRRVTKDELIIGALENAFFHMDSLIAQDRDRYRDAGGCTACVALFIDGKMYIANAGDSRAVLCQRKRNYRTNEKQIEEFTSSNGGASRGSVGVDNDDVATTSIIKANSTVDTYPVPFSADHTPETERHRLLNVARLKPNLLGKHYAAMEYAKRPHSKDLGQRILCRQGTMRGWTYKTITYEDLRMPVVTGEGKRSRLLGTLGVTRGFGDHDLLAINTGTFIKPFLTPHPDVNYRDLTKVVSIANECSKDVNIEDADYGILVMATDGLWDVSENEIVARTVFQTLLKYPTERHRYTMVAQELVARARGKINESGHWRLADSKAAATVDDISVIVIPVYQYFKEHLEWEMNCIREYHERLEKEQQAQQAIEAKEEVSHIEPDTTNDILIPPQNLISNEQSAATAVIEVEEQEEQKKFDQTSKQNTFFEAKRVEKLVEPTTLESVSNSAINSLIKTAGEEEFEDLIDNKLSAAISTLDARESDGRRHSREFPNKKSKQQQQQNSRQRQRKERR